MNNRILRTARCEKHWQVEVRDHRGMSMMHDSADGAQCGMLLRTVASESPRRGINS